MAPRRRSSTDLAGTTRWAWVLLLLLVPAAAHAQETPQPALRVFGAGIAELQLDAQALRALPRTQLSASERGTTGQFEGVALAAILERAGAPLGDTLRGPALRIGVLVRAADGYEALFALAELDPRMTQRSVLLADRRDGAALSAREGPLRIIVPEEGRPARWVRQVISLELLCPGSADGSACRAGEAPAPHGSLR